MHPLFFPSFDKSAAPAVICMLAHADPAEAIPTVRAAAAHRPAGYGFQLEQVPPELRTEERLGKLFAAMEGAPVYATSYRHSRNEGKSDEVLADELLSLCDRGASLIDVMGDLYDRTPGELTRSPAAIRRQETLIAEIHRRGAQVLMSSHVLKYTPAEQVLDIARAQQARGADMVKVVTAADTPEEEAEAFRITSLLHRELSVPFLFLCGGSHCRRHRHLNFAFGCPIVLSVQAYTALSTPTQPPLPLMRSLCDLLAPVHLPETPDVS